MRTITQWRWAAFVLILLSGVTVGTSTGRAQQGSTNEVADEAYELELDPVLTRQFIEEGQREEDLSRKKVVTYAPEIPTAINWCVTQDLASRAGDEGVRVLAVVREPTGQWAMAVSQAGGKTYYTPMIKPPDNIELLGSYEDFEGALGVINSEEGRNGLRTAFQNFYNKNEETAGDSRKQ